ncbi:hypothetical protein [Pseudalkalibacillus caeni]|uniref:Uncharacterized protein n=1 Tax=Exobacillus caeni TaxID=2574798 RepID=A0A5R9F5X8_9BACL|nr:hypothetical protein [Pseudalkalibacillus caeni]TLS35215.1 hypothetical protein FCL54_21700 [Pseudalkalibacillus caeni]
MSWDHGDFSKQHNASAASYTIHRNGAIDINQGKGPETKIGVQPWGMYKLIKEWLDSGHPLTRAQKDELIELLHKEPADFLVE